MYKRKCQALITSEKVLKKLNFHPRPYYTNIWKFHFTRSACALYLVVKKKKIDA